MHLSDVIRDMDKVLSLTTHPDWDTEDTHNQKLFQFEKGYLWEVALSRALGEKATHRPDEMELDGIIMNPDGVVRAGTDIISVPGVVEEYKCTAVSSDKSPADNWKWMMQVKGYCKALGVTKCIFRILHHMDIMWHPETCYGVWELTFTQAQLDENWESVLNHAKTMRGRK